jgi:hypothetical protein
MHSINVLALYLTAKFSDGAAGQWGLLGTTWTQNWVLL